eukprot:CAMPEP_0172368120 /NCGR_PEP_ID=MMETSP1060-20121228/25284_1 /TAXON_ID=37318 /ORGANISM="Pseudo-nitzschia pungens, Strain cf. cingulata" /LENGTH=79 /DNA_ID=CAMNT_0013092601 /DNA_START=27 /DNA_END=266 /DNA_ORIENTATION=-
MKELEHPRHGNVEPKEVDPDPRGHAGRVDVCGDRFNDGEDAPVVFQKTREEEQSHYRELCLMDGLLVRCAATQKYAVEQ